MSLETGHNYTTTLHVSPLSPAEDTVFFGKYALLAHADQKNLHCMKTVNEINTIPFMASRQVEQEQLL